MRSGSPAQRMGPSNPSTCAINLAYCYAQARSTLRNSNGIRVLLQLLQPSSTRPGVTRGSLDKIRALTCRILLGLAKDPAIRCILTRLPVSCLHLYAFRKGVLVWKAFEGDGARCRPPHPPTQTGLEQALGRGLGICTSGMCVLC